MNDIWSCKMEKKSLIVLDFLWADDVRTLYDENVFACNCDKFGTLSAFVTTKKKQLVNDCTVLSNNQVI